MLTYADVCWRMRRQGADPLPLYRPVRVCYYTPVVVCSGAGDPPNLTRHQAAQNQTAEQPLMGSYCPLASRAGIYSMFLLCLFKSTVLLVQEYKY